MNRVFWQKLILRGFGLFEHQVSVDFAQHLNLLLSGNETGKTTLVIGLAATLFGLDHDPESSYSLERFYNWNNPERCEGELFFLVGEQHYHLQRLFANDRVRLRLWKGNIWQSIYEGFDHVADVEESNGFRAVLRKLLGLDDRATFLETFCLSQLESGAFDFSTDLQNLLSNGARYPEAREHLEHRITQSEAKHLQLQKEHQRLSSDMHDSISIEQQLLHHLERLDELQQKQLHDKRRLKQLEETTDAAAEWQRHADSVQVLLGQQAELELAREQSRDQLAKIYHLRDTMEKQAQEYGMDATQLEQRLATLTQKLKTSRQAADEFFKAERGLQRYGPLPLPPGELIPLLERRAELLKKKTLLQESKPHHTLSQRAAIFLACLIGSAFGAIVFFFWGRHQHVLGLVGTVALSLCADIVVYRILPHNSSRGSADSDPLAAELRDQDVVLSGLSLMDPVALVGCLTLLKNFVACAAVRPDAAEQQHLETELTELNQRFSLFRDLIVELKTLQQSHEDLLTERQITAPEELDAALDAVTSKAAGALSSWRKLCLRHPELPEASGRDLSTVLQRFHELQEEHLGLRQSCARAEEEELILQQHLAELNVRSTSNIARIMEQLDELEVELSGLQQEINLSSNALCLLDRAITAFTSDYRQELEDRVADYFVRISGPREQRLLLDAQWQPRLCHETEPLAAVRLSQGTQDQLRFALRLALADHLSGQCSLPLILDDPFANYDAQRRERLAEIVRSLAADRQVWLLSHDDAFASWGEPVVFHSLS